MAYVSREERLNHYGGERHGIFGYMSPFLHPIRWHKACNAHAKICRIHSYLFDQRPRNHEALEIVSNKTWVLFNQVCDWLG